MGNQDSVRCVVFDIGGVLLTLGENGYRQTVARHLGYEKLPPEYEEYVHALQRGEITEEALWAKLAGRELTDAEIDFCEQAFIDHFPPIRPMLDFAAELRSMGVGTAILSNTQNLHVRAFHRLGHFVDFNPVFYSCEIGLRKPDEAVYRHIVAELGLPAHQIAFIDDLEENVQAARLVGIHAIHHTGDVASTRSQVLQLVG